jgi:hypothetical protein
MVEHGEVPPGYVYQTVIIQDSGRKDGKRKTVEKIIIKKKSSDEVMSIGKETSRIAIEIEKGEDYYVSVIDDGETLVDKVYIYGNDELDETTRSFDLDLYR